MSIEWDSLILGGNELNTVGPTEQQRKAGRAHRSGRRCDGQHVTLVTLLQRGIPPTWRW